MSKYIALVFFLFFSIFLFTSCSRAINYKEATVLKKNNQMYIKLRGKRIPITHDPFSIFSNNLYEDSILIPIPKLEDGIIDGKDIPSENGYYKYQGSISITKQKLKVNLQIINTDDNKIVPEMWNGEYYLNRN